MINDLATMNHPERWTDSLQFAHGFILLLLHKDVCGAAPWLVEIEEHQEQEEEQESRKEKKERKSL